MTSKLSGNRGEWSELYALCILLGEGKLHHADTDLSVNESQHVEILSILRKESNDRELEYRIEKEAGAIEVYLNGRLYRTVPQSEFSDTASTMLEILRGRKGHAFSIPELDTFIDAIGITKLKPSDKDKPDITVQIFDPRTAAEFTMNYSVKSFLGSSPSLVNASALTYFYYELVGFDESAYIQVSSLPRREVKKRVLLCNKLASDIRYAHLSKEAETFHNNLLQVHPYAESTLGYMLLDSNFVRGKHSRDILTKLTADNPMHYESPNLYEVAYRDYLWAAFFGMVPSIPWFGRDSVDGYLLIDKNGRALSYLVVKKNSFSDHLLDASHFDTPSTDPKRATCDTGFVFEENGKYYLTLCLQIKYTNRIDRSKDAGFRYAVTALPREEDGSILPSCEEEPEIAESSSRFTIIS